MGSQLQNRGVVNYKHSNNTYLNNTYLTIPTPFSIVCFPLKGDTDSYRTFGSVGNIYKEAQEAQDGRL